MNIDDFDEGVAIIMGKLYESFPIPIQLSANELPNIPLVENDPLVSEKTDRFLDLTDLYYYTAVFLLEEGYIRGEQGQAI